MKKLSMNIIYYIGIKDVSLQSEIYFQNYHRIIIEESESIGFITK